MVIVDTNVLMHPDNLEEILAEWGRVHIPVEILAELDNLKTKEGEKGYLARSAIRAIKKNISSLDFLIHENVAELNRNNMIVDDIIIEHCKKYPEAILITNDISMEVKARAIGIKTTGKEKEDKGYKGYRYLKVDTRVETDNETLALLYQEPNVNHFGLNVNEYLIVKDLAEPLDENEEGCKTIDILKWNGQSHVQLKSPPKRIITPLNDLQACALDLLLDKEVPIKIIAGDYGSGKTLLCTTIGLYMVEEKGDYSKLVLVRNNDLNDSGREIGALPGTFDEKTNILFKTSIQHFPQGEYQAEKMKNEGKLETHITHFIKGLSISGYMTVDEAEDLTVKDIKLVGSRIEKDSCIVFSGDWKQASGKFKNNNGLVHLIESTIDNELVGVVVLDEDVRSSASKVFADL